MTVHLSSTVWTTKIGTKGSSNVTYEDLRTPGLAARVGAAPPDLVAFLGAGGLKAYGFNGAATTEEVHFLVQLPHSYKLGSDINPHVHWAPSTAAAGDVKWQLEYSWIDINGTFGASTTITVTDSTDETAWKHHIAGFSAIEGSGITGISSMLNCRLFRDPTDGADTYGADAIFLEFDFHVELDTYGSLQPLNKS